MSGTSTETGRYVHTYTPTSTQASYTSSPNIRVRLRNATDGAVLKIWNVKHEKGGKATPWIPNMTDTIYSSLGFGNNVEYDISGYGYNGTKTDITYSFDSPKYSSCSVFNGSTSFINCGRAFFVDKITNMTFSVWVYCDDWEAATDKYFISSQESGGIIIR